MRNDRGWYSRGYLPHINAPGRTQFITWRLADSVPAERIEDWRRQLEYLPPNEFHKEVYSRIEKYMDSGHGSCLLRNPVAGLAVQSQLIDRQAGQYQLCAWTVMPNHVHVLIILEEKAELGKVVGAWKGASSREIHRALGGDGHLWQRDYFDRLIRDEGHLERVRAYIEWNAVKAGLCTDPAHWPYSSANRLALEKAHAAFRGSAG